MEPHRQSAEALCSMRACEVRYELAGSARAQRAQQQEAVRAGSDRVPPVQRAVLPVGSSQQLRQQGLRLGKEGMEGNEGRKGRGEGGGMMHSERNASNAQRGVLVSWLVCSEAPSGDDVA
jgi:hypothetical protein